MFRFASLTLLAATALGAHDCIHDHWEVPKAARGHQTYTGHPFEEARGGDRVDEQGRMLSSSDFEPIRIAVELMPEADTDATSANYAFLLDTLLPAAVDKLEATLSVVPVSGNLDLDSSGASACVGGNMAIDIPDSYLDSSTGVADTDFVIFATAKDTTECEGGTTLAYAAACATDQYDRPTHGVVNFCPDAIDEDEYDEQLSTALHEFTHALGFSSSFWPLFRNPDGTAMTDRDGSGNVAETADYDCPSGNTLSASIPSSDYFVVDTERLNRVSKIATPTVLSVVQDLFGCSSLDGAEIENQPTSDGVCFGSHWEERLFPNEFMSAVASTPAAFSNLTLALLEDSGWYKADYSQADTLVVHRGAGCEAATGRCLGDDTSNPTPVSDHFCAATGDSCTADFMSIGYCNIATYSGDLPTAYQYFDDATTGGSLSNADYCPYVAGYSNRYCRDSSQEDDIRGSHYSDDGYSRCQVSTLLDAQYSSTTAPELGCYPIACAANSTQYYPYVNGEWRVCTGEGQEISVSGYNGVLTCSDPAVICLNAEYVLAGDEDLEDLDGTVISGAAAASVSLVSLLSLCSLALSLR